MNIIIKCKKCGMEHKTEIEDIVDDRCPYCKEEVAKYSDEDYFEIRDGVLVRYVGKESLVVVPEGITEVGEAAFAGNKKVMIVVLGDKVGKIDDRAFDGCVNLITVIMPDSLSEIGYSAFSESGIVSVKLPAALKEIADATFCECGKLKSIKLPDRLRKIGAYAFVGCEELSDVVFHDSLVEIGSQAFEGCESLGNVFIGNNIKIVGDSAFDGCGATVIFESRNKKTGWSDSAFSGNRLIWGKDGDYLKDADDPIRLVRDDDEESECSDDEESEYSDDDEEESDYFEADYEDEDESEYSEEDESDEEYDEDDEYVDYKQCEKFSWGYINYKVNQKTKIFIFKGTYSEFYIVRNGDIIIDNSIAISKKDLYSVQVRKAGLLSSGYIKINGEYIWCGRRRKDDVKDFCEIMKQNGISVEYEDYWD